MPGHYDEKKIKPITQEEVMRIGKDKWVFSSSEQLARKRTEGQIYKLPNGNHVHMKSKLKVDYAKLKKQDPRAFNTAVDMQVEADMEKINSKSDSYRNKKIKDYEKYPDAISDQWYMATFSVYKSKDFSGYIQNDRDLETIKEQKKIMKAIDEADEDDADTMQREDNIMTAAYEQAEQTSRESPNLDRDSLFEYHLDDPGTIDDDILLDNGLVRTEDGYIMSYAEFKRDNKVSMAIDGKNNTKLAKDFPNRRPNNKEPYLEQSDKSKMNTNGPGKGWHGERMRHRDAALKRRK